ncbi:Aste57867_10578 [Aphanomyces stellatus]|uniref:Aste57867_10578 protein n=1 Tax=Aphanomyces stellatus TaxID=120398 RepID=A0A485KRB4_9STRA|nr:hypothetical protein As57867_010538 [Aphanomyces stellatus]VFT87451.1 Aste57867_10578 [Aphanomyces stellatus]
MRLSSLALLVIVVKMTTGDKPPPPAGSLKKHRVAIIGGGLGGLAAAWALTNDANQQAVDVTVYQMGWRLGGKCATGRDRAHHDRAYEHGLHVFSGFYDQAFTMLREVYAELDRDPVTHPLASIDRAFVKAPPVLDMTESAPYNSSWRVALPHNNGQPGQPTPAPLGDKIAVATRLTVASGILTAFDSFYGFVAADAVLHFASAPVVTAINGLAAVLQSGNSSVSSNGVGRTLVLGALRASMAAVRTVAAIPFVWNVPGLRRSLIALDAVLALERAAVRDRVAEQGRFDHVAHFDLMDWLVDRGGMTLGRRLPVFDMLYEAAFAFPSGDRARRALDAAAGFKILSHIVVGYRGALLYKMTTGMAETVVQPLYEVLVRRGVRFEFFHRARRLGLASNATVVDEIEFDVQATVQGHVYTPTYNVKGVDVWPSEPFYDQLVEGEALKRINLEGDDQPRAPRQRILQRGRDFDDVVVATSIEPLRWIAADLIDTSPAWRNMVDRLPTVATVAAQFWVRTTCPTPRDAPAMTMDLTPPFESVMAMHDTLQFESWPTHNAPTRLYYTCGVLPDEHARNHSWLFKQAKQWWLAHANRLLVIERQNETWRHLYVERNDTQTLDDALRQQYIAMNVDASDRYVLSVPGTAQYRLDGTATGFANVFLAGDFTKTSWNLGCAEMAIESGLAVGRTLRRRVSDARPQGSTSRRAQLPHDRAKATTHQPRRYWNSLGSHDAAFGRPDARVAQHGNTTFFVVPVTNPARLQAEVDGLNDAAGLQGRHRYRAVSGYVAVAYADYPVGQVTGQVENVSERVLAVFVPVMRGSWSMPMAIEIPFIAVDNPISFAIGRDLFGYPKILGQFHLDENDGVRVDVFGATALDPNYSWRRLLEIETTHHRDDAKCVRPTAMGATMTDMLTAMNASWPFSSWRECFNPQRQVVLCLRVPMIFLRQTRDLTSPHHAAWSELVDGSIDVGFEQVTTFDPKAYRLRWSHVESLPVAQRLGFDEISTPILVFRVQGSNWIVPPRLVND